MIGKVMTEEKMKKLMGENGIIEEGFNQMIPIDMLKPCGFNTYAIEDVETLEREIRVAGLITPLTVIGPDEDGYYRILSGERRYHALLRIHSEDAGLYDRVNCFVCGRGDMDMTAQKLIMEIANVSVRKIDEIPHRFAIVRLLKELTEKGLMNEWKIGKNLAEYLGVTPRYARCYKKVIFSGNPDLEKMVEDKTIDIKLAAYISGMEEEGQDSFIERVRQGEDAWEIYKKEYRKGNPEKENEPEENTVVAGNTIFARRTNESDLSDPNEGTQKEHRETVTIDQDKPAPGKTGAEGKKEIPQFDPGSFSTEKLKDIFNEYTGNPYEEVFYPEQEITAKTEIDYTRTRRDLKILLEKDELSTEDEKLVELCASITEKFECY